MSVDSTVSDIQGMATSGADTETETAAADAGSADEPEPLPMDAVFEVLKNERRRRVIEYLRSNEGAVELGDVAEHIAALENDKEESAISYAERKRVYVGLYQCHLPKMDDMGVVEFNRSRGRIELTEQADQLLPYIDGPKASRPWHRYYAGIVLAGTALLVVAGALPGLLTPGVVLVGVLGAVACCSVAHFSEVQD